MHQSPIQRTALVTGSGQNIGRSIAIELADRGHNLVLNGSSNRKACQDVADTINAKGGKAIVAMGDIGDRAAVDAISEQSLQTFGAIDILVNNAAIRPNFSFLDGSEDDWENVWNTNFMSGFRLSRAFLPGMIEKQWGRIVFFSGMNAQQGYPGKSAVTVSKHAAWGLTKSLAKEFGAHGITANIISPGTIVGEVDNSRMAGKYDALKQANPSGRLGIPEDIASTVGFLASDESGFMNGQLLQVNGGVVV